MNTAPRINTEPSARACVVSPTLMSQIAERLDAQLKANAESGICVSAVHITARRQHDGRLVLKSKAHCVVREAFVFDPYQI